MIVYIQTYSVAPVQIPFKQLLDNPILDLKALRGKCELHYLIPALWSLPPQTKPYQWVPWSMVPYL